MSQNQTCPECGENCEPECGQHPAGCLFSGMVYGEWAIAPRCKLEHRDIALAKARDFLRSLDIGTKIMRYPD